MLQMFFTNEENKLITYDTESIVLGMDLTGKWLHLSNPTDKEIEFVNSLTSIPEDFIKAALDEEERSRIEVEDGNLLTIFDIPILEDDDNNDYYSYSTLPFAFISNQKTVVTVCLKDTIITQNFITGRIKSFATYKRTRFLLQLMYATSTKFLQYLRQIDKTSTRIQNELNRSMKNKELIQLLDIEKSLVYFSTSLRGNSFIVDKINRVEGVKFYEEDTDLWEDVGIETRQAIEMCNIYRDILSGTMDAFASVISNNLNIVMRLLTILTLLVAIPSMIASFFGMNTGVPWQGQISGFYIVVGISIAICVVVGAIMFRKRK
ncbi:MAG: magnesium transporter CorA family protein [Clostridia bacterium]